VTFFLKPAPDTFAPKVDQTSGGIPDFWDGVSAAFKTAQIENDANFMAGTATRKEARTRALASLGRLDQDALDAEIRKRGANPSGVDLETVVRKNPLAAKIVLDAARRAALSDPAAWADIDPSDDGIANSVNEKFRAEYQDAQSIIAAMPGGQTMAGLIGGITGITADVKNIPLLMIGGGEGAFLKVIAREAAINVGAELAAMPAQFAMAERLNIPDPSIGSQLAMAAAGGAGFAAIFDGLPRALRYAAARNAVETIPGMTAADSTALLDSIERAMVGDDPFADVKAIIDEVAPPPPPPPAGMPPLVPVDAFEEMTGIKPGLLDGFSSQATAPEPTALAPDPIVTDVLPPAQGEPPRSDAELVALADAGITEAAPLPDFLRDEVAQIESAAEKLEKGATFGRRYPLLYALKGMGVRINPDSPFGQELLSMGITPKTMPGLFSRKISDRTFGTTDLDNLVASELEDTFPGIWDATGTPRSESYLDSNGVFDLIRREAAGDHEWMPDVQQAKALRAEASKLQSQTTALDDFVSKAAPEVPDGLFIDVMLREFSDPNARLEIYDEVGRYLDEYHPNLYPAERDEILHYAATRGGSVDYLVEQALYRSGAALEASPPSAPINQLDDIPWDTTNESSASQTGNPQAQNGNASGAPGPVTEQARGSGADQANVGRDAGEVRSPGDQLAIPGTERSQTGLSQSQRAEMDARQQQSKMRRLDQSRVEDDDGGLFGGAQTDLFSEPTSKEARAVMDTVADDLRAEIEAGGDFKVDMGDGKGERLASDVLADLDEGDKFSARIDLCGKGPT
jgi:hypothetical protein